MRFIKQRTSLFIFFTFFLFQNVETIQMKTVIEKLDLTLNFIDREYKKFGFDGIFGLTLAESYLLQLLHQRLPYEIQQSLHYLIVKCNHILSKAKPSLPNTKPSYTLTFKNKLLVPIKWAEIIPNDSTNTWKIPNLGIYKNWTIATILNKKQASYKGIGTDFCLKEILELSFTNICFVSEICREMMLNMSRIDTGYLLTHRLLYLQTVRLQACTIPGFNLQTNNYTYVYCSYIYKEAKTNEYLGYPYHDIFLEQVVFCGMEGFTEFLNENWLKEILSWQNPQGCYASIKNRIKKKTSNLIGYGCSDHSTGLGAAALALFLKNIIYNNFI